MSADEEPVYNDFHPDMFDQSLYYVDDEEEEEMLDYADLRLDPLPLERYEQFYWWAFYSDEWDITDDIEETAIDISRRMRHRLDWEELYAPRAPTQEDNERFMREELNVLGLRAYSVADVVEALDRFVTRTDFDDEVGRNISDDLRMFISYLREFDDGSVGTRGV